VCRGNRFGLVLVLLLLLSSPLFSDVVLTDEELEQIRTSIVTLRDANELLATLLSEEQSAHEQTRGRLTDQISDTNRVTALLSEADEQLETVSASLMRWRLATGVAVVTAVLILVVK
jgi:hypothetical protein